MSRQDSWLKRHEELTMISRSRRRSQVYDGQIGFNYTTTTGHSFGAYYQGMGKPERAVGSSASVFDIEDQGAEHSELTWRDKTNYYQHLADAYYSGMWGRWTADITFDYLWRRNKDDRSVFESLPMSAASDFYDKSDGRMIAAEGNLARPLWRGNLQVGAAYTNSHRYGEFTNPQAWIPASDNKVEESDIAVYAQSAQRFGPIMAQLGLRYEHIGSSFFENGIKVGEQSRDYNEFLPSASLTVPWKKVMFQLSYSRRYTRPLYSQLSSAVIYNDKYLYQTGNPNLKSCYTDAVSLTFRYSWLMIMASYKHVKDKVISVSEAYEPDPDITLLKKINSPRGINSIEVMASLAPPNFLAGFYYPMLTCGIVAQFYEVEYRGTLKKMDNPMGMVMLNNIFRLPGGFQLTANFNWRSRAQSENIDMRGTWRIDLGAARALGTHWDVRLALTDLFNTGRRNAFTLYSGPRSLYIEKKGNTRGVQITVGYRFNVAKSKYKGRGAGQSEKDRL